MPGQALWNRRVLAVVNVGLPRCKRCDWSRQRNRLRKCSKRLRNERGVESFGFGEIDVTHAVLAPKGERQRHGPVVFSRNCAKSFGNLSRNHVECAFSGQRYESVDVHQSANPSAKAVGCRRYGHATIAVRNEPHPFELIRRDIDHQRINGLFERGVPWVAATITGKCRAMNRVPLRTQSICHLFEVRPGLPRAVNEYECFSHFYLECRYIADPERDATVL